MLVVVLKIHPYSPSSVFCQQGSKAALTVMILNASSEECLYEYPPRPKYAGVTLKVMVFEPRGSDIEVHVNVFNHIKLPNDCVIWLHHFQLAVLKTIL